MNVAADTNPILLDWRDITAMAQTLGERVLADGAPDVLIGVLRGGMIPAVLLSRQLGIRSVRAIDVTHTTSDRVGSDKTAFPRITNVASLGDLHQMAVLVVDDIAGTGDTVACVAKLAIDAGAVEVRTAVCAVNSANWLRRLPPEQELTYIGTIVHGWVIFPWET